jgi:hypothetical protein
MTNMTVSSLGAVDPAQAIELCRLVELEARWENGRKNASREPNVASTSKSLQGKQQAYEAFRAKLVEYNKRYTPAHVPELLLNTPTRLGKWCRTMRDLFLQVEHHPQGHCPVHLLEKAHRWAAGIRDRVNADRLSLATPPHTIRDAIDELDTLGRWCEDLVVLAPGADRVRNDARGSQVAAG